jgi:hypothetical protein
MYSFLLFNMHLPEGQAGTAWEPGIGRNLLLFLLLSLASPTTLPPLSLFCHSFRFRRLNGDILILLIADVIWPSNVMIQNLGAWKNKTCKTISLCILINHHFTGNNTE